MVRGNPRRMLERNQEIVIDQIGDWSVLLEHRRSRSPSLSPRNLSHFVHSIHRYPCNDTKSSTRLKRYTANKSVDRKEKAMSLWSFGVDVRFQGYGFEQMEAFLRTNLCSNP